MAGQRRAPAAQRPSGQLAIRDSPQQLRLPSQPRLVAQHRTPAVLFDLPVERVGERRCRPVMPPPGVPYVGE